MPIPPAEAKFGSQMHGRPCFGERAGQDSGCVLNPPDRLIPQSTIERVAAANDIVEVVGAVVQLKRLGARWRALCPFHREKTPSFYVDSQRQNYKCFGCGVGGSVFKFVMAYENLDFPSAVRRLAERANVQLSEDELRGGDDDGTYTLRKRLITLHGEAAEWYHRQLLKSPAAQPVRDYLRARGIGREIAVNWKLGYAPDAWSELRDWGLEAGYSLEELTSGGLVVVREEESGEKRAGPKRGKGYDRFRDRLMIPICNEQGEVVAFSGRVHAAAEQTAKYVNSPETPIFTKGAVLFGLHKSRRPIIAAGRAIVCEGQLDLITAYENGVTNVTAPQGTAFTPKQAAILRRCCEEVVLCFDADAAGQQAAERSFAALLEANISVRVATMPPGEDPDSMIRTRGADAFRERIAAAQDFFDFQMDRLAATIDIATPRGQATYAKRLAETVRLVGDPLLRDAVAGKVAARLGLAPDRFREVVARTPRRPLFREDAAIQLAERTTPVEKTSLAIRHLALLALEHRESREWLLAQPDWRAVLGQVSGGALLQRALEAKVTLGEAASVNAFLSTLPFNEEEWFSDRLAEPLPQHPEVVREDSWQELESEIMTGRRDRLQALLRAPALDLEEAARINQEVLALQKSLGDIARLRSTRRSPE